MYPHQCTRLEDLLNALSSGLRGAAIEMSERLDLQVDLIIINMISAICSQYQGLADYENLEGRRRPISENVIIVGPKASGKTKAGRAIFDGLKDLDKQVAAARDDVKQEREFERKLWDDEEKVLRSKYRRSLKDGLPTKADVEKLSQHAKIRKEKIAIFQLFYEKITLAGIEKLLSNPGIAITFASDEGFKVAESGPLKDPGMASQAFDGTPQSKFTASSSYRTDDYRLSMRLDFQPEVFEKIFLTPGNQQVMVGFMQRCLYYFTNHVHDGGSPDAKKGPMEEQFLAGLLHVYLRRNLSRVLH